MRRQARKPLIGVISIVVVGAFLFTVKWTADPQPTRAAPPDSPSTSILFIIDSSPNMFPWDGTDYFQLAVDGILDFLYLPGFPQDGSYEIGVMQFTQHGVPGYTKADATNNGIVHWIPPTWIKGLQVGSTGKTDWELMVKWLGRMKSFAHPTSSLMDIGFKQAPEMFTAPLGQADASTSKHVILIGTGEYRLPQPCPHDGFTPGACAQNCDGNANYQFGSSAEVCNRACHTRCSLSDLRSALGSLARVSTIRVGPEWHNYYPPAGINAEDGGPLAGLTGGGEADPPYWNGSVFDYCQLEIQPDRKGFLREIAGWANDSGDCCENVQQQCLAPDGEHARIPPLVRFGCSGGECKPGTSKDVAKAITGWLCDWEETVDTDGDGKRNLCDNCPFAANPRQRDCNLDGIGDLCQTTADCEGSIADSDLDGLCDGLDTCPDGDDCLVRFWVADDPAGKCDALDDLGTCGCDCDGSEEPVVCPTGNCPADICQAAQRFAENTLPAAPPSSQDPDSAVGFDDGTFFEPDAPSFAYDGVPDCAQGITPSCVPIPEVCDLNAELAGTPPSYRLAFAGYLGSPPPGDWLNESGWSVDGFTGALSIADASYPGGNSLNIAQGATGTISSPLFKLPPVRECTFCDTNSTGCPFIGEWSYFVIEVDFRVDNAGDTSKHWDIFIYDRCDFVESPRVRAHVLIADRPGDSSEDGRLYLAQDTSACGEPNCLCEDDSTEALCWAQFDRGIWSTVQILFDNTDSYFYNQTSKACDFSGLQDGAVAVYSTTHSSYCGPFPETEPPLFGEAVPFGIPGLQVVVSGSGGAPAMKIGKIEIRPISGCEFSDPDGWPCVDETCKCNNTSGHWSCEAYEHCNFWD